jgi:hypothetical protein
LNAKIAEQESRNTITKSVNTYEAMGAEKKRISSDFRD